MRFKLIMRDCYYSILSIIMTSLNILVRESIYAFKIASTGARSKIDGIAIVSKDFYTASTAIYAFVCP